MHKRTLISGLLIAVLVMFGSIAASAQEPTFGLSDTDFALWSGANAQSAAATSLQFEGNLQFGGEMDGIPGSLTVAFSGGLNNDTDGGLLVDFVVDLDGGIAGNAPNHIEGGLRVVDGNFYVNVTDPNTGEPTGWMGDSIENLTAAASSSAGSGLGGGVPSVDSLQPSLEALMGVGAAIDPNTLISITRESDDGANAVFTTEVTLADFIASDGGTALIDALLGAASQAQPDALPPGMGAQSIMPMIQPVFENLVIQLQQTIDTDSNHVTAADFTFALNLDPQSFPLIPSAISLNLGLQISLTGYGEPFEIAVPEGATMGVLAAAANPPAVPTIDPQVVPQDVPDLSGVIVPLTAGEHVVAAFDSAPLTFSYEGTENEVVTIIASSTSGNLDTTLTLLAADGTQVAFNDDHGSTLDLARFDSMISDIELPSTETYLIVVNTFGGSGTGEIDVVLTSGEGTAQPDVQPTATPTEQAPTDEPSEQPVQGLAITAGVENSVVFIDQAVNLTYEGTEGEVITITASSEDGSLDTTLTLLNPDGDEIAFNDDHGSSLDLNTFDSAVQDVELASDGVYTIVVDTFSGSGDGVIIVTLTNEDAGGSSGSNNSGSSGQTTEPIIVTGEVPDDEFYTFEFDGTEGEVVTITARATDNSLDPVMSLLDPSGDEVADNDDHEDDDPALERFDSRIEAFTLPDTGTYTVQVRGYGGNGGELELTVERVGSGGSTASDEPIVIEGSVDANEAFEYELTVDAGDMYTITVHGADTDMDSVLSLYDDRGRLVISNDDHGTASTELFTFDSMLERYIFEDSGTYTIEVTEYSGDKGDFTLTIEHIGAGAPIGDGETTEIEGRVRSNRTTTEEFDFEEGQVVTITVQAVDPAELDTVLSLISPDGEIVATNDDHGASDRTLGRYDSRISDFVIEDSGTYSIEISGFGDSAGDYVLSINVK